MTLGMEEREKNELLAAGKKKPVKPLCVLNVLCPLETFFPIEFSFVALQDCEVEGLNMKESS